MYFLKLLIVISFIAAPVYSSAKKSKRKASLKKSGKQSSGVLSKFKILHKNLDIEYQIKGIKNAEQGVKYGQDWSSAQAKQLYAVTKLDFKFYKHHFKINTFIRYAESELYQNNRIATLYALHPQRAIPRTMSKISYIKEKDGVRQEVLINQLTYDWGHDDMNFSIGRMIIDYGSGLTINPINPFNYNAFLANTYKINQGNDGLRFTLTRDAKVKLNFFFLGDKSFTDYDNQITRTILMRGDWDKSNTVKVTYILGEDQKRHKYGFEVKKSLEKGFAFIQAVKFSKRLDDQASKSRGLLHYLLGYERDIREGWTTRVELGKFSIDPKVALNDPGTYLPFDSIFAVYNTYQINKKWNTEGGFIMDRASGASFYKISGIYQHNKRITGRLFTSSLLAQAKDSDKYLPQKFIPTEFGMAARISF